MEHGINTSSHFCLECGKNFNKKSKFIIHMRNHTGERPYICDVCGKGFTNTSSLRTHNRIHSGEKPYMCDICGRRFTENSALKKHIMRHKGERTYICKICNKAFNTNSDLAVHVKIHSLERSFVCDLCKKIFSFKSTLKRHIYNFHLKPKSYTCILCNESFLEYGVLKKHKKMHSKGKVKTLSNSSELCDKKMFDIHNIGGNTSYLDPPRFWCSICGKVYATKYNMSNHMLKHESDIAAHVCTLQSLPEEVFIKEEPEIHLNENIVGEEELQFNAETKTISCRDKSFQKRTNDENVKRIVCGKLQPSVVGKYNDIKVKEESVDFDIVENAVMIKSEVPPVADNELLSPQHSVTVFFTDSNTHNFQEDVELSCGDYEDNADPLA